MDLTVTTFLSVPPMFTFRDQDGNRYRVVERD
jgi:hypothetical protein